MARKFPNRHPNKPTGAKLPPRTIMGGLKKPRATPKPFTGKGTHGTGLGYHGKPRGATTPAKGKGYHGHPPMVVPHSKPPSHKAGTKRHPGK